MLRAALRSLLSHRLRLTLTVLAIAAGVAFVAGTYIFTDSLRRSFDELFTVNQPDVTVSFHSQLGDSGQGPGGGQGADQSQTLPAGLVAKVERVDGVAAAYGAVQAQGAIVIAADGAPLAGPGRPTTGQSWLPEAPLRNLTVSSGRAPDGRDSVALLAATAEAAGVGIGDRVRIDTPAGVVDPTVVGLLDRGIAGSDGGTLAVFDLPTAQRLLLRDGSALTSILVQAAPGVSQQQLADRIAAILPADAQVQTGQARSADLADRLSQAFTFINTFLLVFALIALFVACFLIYNTFTMLVAQRTRELALLRAVGASRGQVRRSVVVEAAALGLVASAVGLAGGIGVATLLRVLFGRFGAELPAGPLVVEPRTVLVSVLVGLAVTVGAAYLPARRAAVIPPVAALREEVSLPTRSLRVRTGLGVGLAVLAVLLARQALSTTDDVERAAALAGLSALAALVATIAATPVVGRGVLRVLGAPFARSAVGRLATENGRRNPRRTAATAGALAIGLALMSAVGVIAASAKASVDQVVDDTIGADYLVLSASLRPFTPDAFQALQGTPGTAVVTFSRNVPATLGGERVLVTGVQPDAFGQVFDVTMQQGTLAGLGLGGALVDATTAAQQGLIVGRTVPVQYVNGPGQLRIDGIYTPSGVTQGLVVSIPTLTSVGSLELDSAVYVRLAPGADPSTVRAELTKRLAPFPSLQLTDQTELKDQIDSQFDRVFGFIYALLALAVLVAFLGIVNTLALSVHERRREVGLLRAVGTSRAQLRRMVILESVLISVFGGIVGVALGLAYGSLLQRVLEPQGVTVLAIPAMQLVYFIGAAVVGGFLAALWPAVTAARLNVLRAIATE